MKEHCFRAKYLRQKEKEKDRNEADDDRPSMKKGGQLNVLFLVHPLDDTTTCYEMWQQQWPDYPGAAPAANGVDWGAVAQQWMRNKEMYEQWQKQQYEQHLQMVAAAQAAQMAQSVNPAVVSNPPPPPPPPPPLPSATEPRAEASADSGKCPFHLSLLNR